MSVIIGSGVVAAVAVGYLGRKGWLAFHRAVGITPGKMVYTPPSQLPLPVMVQLTLNESQLRYLPPSLIAQITRIDKKSDSYQAMQNQLTNTGKTPIMTEDSFILSKLLTTRLPEMLDNYQYIATHEHTLSNASSQTMASSPNLQQALELLTELLTQIESKLDAQIKTHQNSALQDMQALGRYLEDR